MDGRAARQLLVGWTSAVLCLIATAASGGTISGTVFEDVNYGGGAGRTRAASSGAALANVRVELYSGGNLTLTATTDAAGAYSFNRNAGTYVIRVANRTIATTRTGGCAAGTCLPVQTYRTNASTGAAVAVTDHVGGETPTLIDAGNGATTLAALTTATTTAQSITTVVLAANGSTVTGVDFGFNFDTIVNTADTGQGS